MRCGQEIDLLCENVDVLLEIDPRQSYKCNAFIVIAPI